MKRFYILIALFCFALSAQAQFGVGGADLQQQAEYQALSLIR